MAQSEELGWGLASVRELIVDNLTTALAAMSVAGGYNYDYPAPQRYQLMGQVMATKPAIVVVPLGEEKEIGSSEIYECTLAVGLFVWADHPAAQSAISSDAYMDRIIRDVERAVMVDVGRGGKAVDTLLRGFERITMSEGGGEMCVRVDVDVWYRHRLSDPNLEA